MTVSPPVASGSAPPSPDAGASAWVSRWLAAMTAGGRVLDFAAGGGRHDGLYRRLRAEAWVVDVDEHAIARWREAGLPADRAIVADLEGGGWPLPRRAFDAVVVTRYLHRPRFALLADLLAAGGLLVYETFANGQARYGRPTRPAFLLEPGELLARCARAGLSVVAYEDGVTGGTGNGGPAPARVQRVCAVRPPFDPARFDLNPPLG
ncbi:MAG: class I SAM-dependent methyltransferase [Burkholderiaceae bacterium]